MIFSPSFYYTAMVLNVLMRAFFLAMIAHESIPNKFRIFFVLAVVTECIRKTLWCIIRMENE